jgi:NAD(P)H-dependent flavin oxidoreductase YrpB (nitropropane dioxygenase family)
MQGGGHTGDVPFTVLAPRVVELCRGHKSPLTGKPIMTVAAGGVYRGKSLAAALCYGSDAVWVGTRFIMCKESGSPKKHIEAVIKATHESDIRTLLFTGRPLRVIKTPYIEKWEAQPEKIKEFLNKGVIPAYHDMENDDEEGTNEKAIRDRWLMGKSAAVLTADDLKSAKEIVDDFINEAVESLHQSHQHVVSSRL